jgi:hypothetical protein
MEMSFLTGLNIPETMISIELIDPSKPWINQMVLPAISKN